jgi:AcrR family transcriptional regulator
VAERAGVQRNTFYRHFPDERSLFDACSGHSFEQHPVPSTDGWDQIEDPVQRARHGLGELYRYWAATEEMNTKVLRDIEQNATVREVAQDRFGKPMEAIQDALLSAWPRGRARKRLAAAVGLAIHFRTWQSLVREGGLGNDAAADLMATMLGCAGS